MSFIVADIEIAVKCGGCDQPLKETLTDSIAQTEKVTCKVCGAENFVPRVIIVTKDVPE